MVLSLFRLIYFPYLHKFLKNKAEITEKIKLKKNSSETNLLGSILGQLGGSGTWGRKKLGRQTQKDKYHMILII